MNISGSSSALGNNIEPQASHYGLGAVWGPFWIQWGSDYLLLPIITYNLLTNYLLLQIINKLPQKCPKSVPTVPQQCPKSVPKVPPKFPNSFPTVSQKCPKSYPKVPIITYYYLLLLLPIITYC